MNNFYIKHLGSKKIHTERLTLRPFTMKDAEMMFSHWASDDEVTKYVPWDTHSLIEVLVLKQILQDKHF